jgi:ubiquinone/menaquinone biosynthesis C-methylase UbiE
MTIRPEELTSNRVYDGYASTYGFDVDASLSARLKYDLAIKYLKADDVVIDVGCANAIHMRLLANKCKQIIGIDINKTMLDAAREKLTEDRIANATLKQCSATEIEFADGSFDLVYSFSTLTLVPDVARALREISRVLRPGGIAILDFAGRWNLSHLYWNLYYRRHGHFGQHGFEYRKIATQLELLGLQILEKHALGFLDQWRYVPVLHWCKGLHRVFHASRERDLDYRISNRAFFFPLANRWYVACRKVA